MKIKITNSIQFFLLLFMMTMGFFLSYALLWFAIGLPVSGSTFWVLTAISVLSEVVFCIWVVGT